MVLPKPDVVYLSIIIVTGKEKQGTGSAVVTIINRSEY
jgi:hypothetical protein